MFRFNGCQNGYGWLMIVLLNGLLVLFLYSASILIDTSGLLAAHGVDEVAATAPGVHEPPAAALRSSTRMTETVASETIRSIRSRGAPWAPLTARPPGLAAPALLTYQYGVTLNGPPDPTVWDFFTDPSVTVSYPGDGLRSERGAQYEADWTPEVMLQAKPRLNFSGVPGTMVEWQVTIGAQQVEAVVYLKLIDEDADRFFELACGEHEVAGQWDCDLFLRRLSDHAHLWHGGKLSVLRGEPAFSVGAWHRLALVYAGGQSVTLRVDETFEQTFALTDELWNGLDWLRAGYQVNGWAERTATLDTTLGFLRFHQANDEEPPLLAVGGLPAGGWSHGGTVSYSGSDGGSGFRCIRAAWNEWPPDDGACYETSGVTSLPSPGSHTLYLRGWDWAGNPATASAVYHHLAPPSLHTLALLNDGSSYTATWADPSGGSVHYEVQAATDEAFTSPLSSGWVTGQSYTFGGLANCQTYYYRLRSRDGGGSESGWSATVSASQDYARPSGTVLLNGGAAYTHDAEVTLTLNVSDDCAGNLQMRLRNAGETWSEWEPLTPSRTWFLSGGEGLKTVEVEVTDALGAGPVASATITLDTTRPVVNNLAASPQRFSPNGDGRSDAATVSATVEEAHPGAWQIQVLAADGSVVRQAGGGGATVSWAWDGRSESGAVVADGQYEVQVTATDAAGNATLTAASVIVIVDTQAPQGVGLFHPSRGDAWGEGETVYTNRNQLAVRGYTGEAGDQVTVNGMTVAVGGLLNEFAATLPLTAGEQTVTVVAEDEVGNQTVLMRTVVYDERGPALSSYSPSGVINEVQPVVSGLFDLRGGSPLDLSQVKLYRSGVDVTTSATITADGFTYLPDPPLADGEHSFHVTLVNQAGNGGEFGWSVTVDRQTQVELLWPMEGAVLNVITQTVQGRSEAGASITLALDGQPLGQTAADASGNFTFTQVLLPADGIVTLTATATDALGNGASTTATVTMAEGKPGAGVRVAPNPFASSAVFGLSASGLPDDPLAGWTLLVGGQPITSGVTLPPAQWLWDGKGLPDGTYPVRLAVTTTSGISVVVAGPNLVRDTTPPAAPVITAPADGHITALPQVQVTGSAEPFSAITLVNGGLFTIPVQVDGQGAWQVTLLLEGGWNDLRATATDRAGQVSGPSNLVRAQVPVEPPLIDVGTSAGFVGLGAPVELWAAARGVNHPDGPATAWVRSGLPDGTEPSLSQTAASQSQPVGRWTFDWAVAADTAHGPHSLLLTAEDQIGLRGQGRTALFVDAVLPAAPLLLQPVGAIHLASPTVQVVGKAEPLGTVLVYLGDTVVQTVRADAQGNWRTTVTVSEGMHRLYARVRDAAGNQSLPSLASRILHDRTPPVVTGFVTPAFARPGQELTFGAVVTDASPLARVQLRIAGGEWLTLFDRNGEWQRGYPGVLPVGVYPLSFEAVDSAGNVGYGSATLVIDDTAPTVRLLTVTASQPYAYLSEVQAAVPGVAPTVYYGVGSGQITVTASLSDDLAGLDAVTFPDAAGPGASYAQNGVASATVQHVYTFDAAAAFSGPVAIQASDRAGNTIPSNVVLHHDTTGPTLKLNASSEGLTLSIAWAASDADAGLNRCLLELVDGGVATTIASTCTGSLDYPATQDQAYTVRLTAWDNVANRAVQEMSTTVSSVTKYYYHGSRRVAVRKGGQVYYLHGDHLGSTSLTTDSSGQVVHEARYLPYGQVRWESGASTTDFGFTGQRGESSFGLMDFNARYYNARLGTFISPDTIIPDPRNGQSWNRYLYGANNPIRYTDPSGHCIFGIDTLVCAIAAVIAGGAVGYGAGRAGYEVVMQQIPAGERLRRDQVGGQLVTDLSEQIQAQAQAHALSAELIGAVIRHEGAAIERRTLTVLPSSSPGGLANTAEYAQSLLQGDTASIGIG
jgi:RHS repeat-associated protein